MRKQSVYFNLELFARKAKAIIHNVPVSSSKEIIRIKGCVRIRIIAVLPMMPLLVIRRVSNFRDS